MINTNPNSRSAVFDKVGALSLSRTAFNLSEERSFDCDLGQIIPIYHRYGVPGDTFKIDVRSLIKFNPLVSPFYGRINVRYDLFKVPFRLLWFDWEEYLTKGSTGTYTSNLPLSLHKAVLPSDEEQGLYRYTGFNYFRYSLWDYLGYPEPHIYDENGNDISEPKYLSDQAQFVSVLNESLPHAFPAMAYYAVYNDYYRDQNLEKPFIWYGHPDCGYTWKDYDFSNPSSANVASLLSQYSIVPLQTNVDSVLKRSYRKDYFTSALPFQQRGVAPAIPISGIIPVDMEPQYAEFVQSVALSQQLRTGAKESDVIESPKVIGTTGNTAVTINSTTSQGLTSVNGSINLAGATTADISAFRLAFAIQKWQERNARAGVRYTEYLQAHYGVKPRDERLQRPEFIGSIVHPVVVSEVLQTSQTTEDSALGDFAGHAQGSDIGGFESVFCEEFCVILCTMTIIPKPVYTQGVKRELLYRSPLEFFTPEFQNLSEQAVLNNELFVSYQNRVLTESSESTPDKQIFGFQGRFNELRTSYDTSCGALRGNSLGKWTLTRNFKTPPILNKSFIGINGDDYKDILSTPTSKTCLCNVGVNVTAIRPLQYVAEPGLIDHN